MFLASRKLTLANKRRWSGSFARESQSLASLKANTLLRDIQRQLTVITVANVSFLIGLPSRPLILVWLTFDLSPVAPLPTQLTCLTAGLNWNSPASFRSSQIIGIRGTASIAAESYRHRRPLRCQNHVGSFLDVNGFPEDCLPPNNCVMYPFTLQPEAGSARCVKDVSSLLRAAGGCGKCSQ